MNVNKATISLIKQWEGCKLTAYQDGGGVWTIGYGTTAAAGLGIEPTKGMTITQERAEELLRQGVDKFEAQVDELITAKVNDNQFGACVSLAYNIGPDAFAKSTVLRELNAGNKDKAAAAFRMWDKDNGKVEKGLVNRREAEIALFLTPATADMHVYAPEFDEPVPFNTAIIRVMSTLIWGRKMNSSEIGGIVRTLVTALVAYLAGKNVIDNETAATIGGAVSTMVVAAWSVWSKRKA